MATVPSLHGARRSWERYGEIAFRLAGARPLCTVYALSHSEHVLQIYTGLYALEAAGCIRLRQRFGARALAWRLASSEFAERYASAKLNGLFVDVEGAGLVFFDLRDSGECYEDVAERVVLYAKRSYRRAECPGEPRKFVPFGVNYSVYPSRATVHALVRAVRQLDGSRLAAKRALAALLGLAPSMGSWLALPTLESLIAFPDESAAPQAIFLANAWPPEHVIGGIGVADLNDSRAACIRALRRAFGPRFLGGFTRTPYALQHYPDCVVGPEVNTERRHYLQRLKAYPVCIATTGLFFSIGWKFAEYLGLAKAIACEPLHYELPGPIAPGENYLEFRTADECVTRVAKLLDDRDARLGMMSRNAEYFAEFGRPDAAVGRALHAALS